MLWSSRYVPQSLPRRWMHEIVHFGRRAPIVGGHATLGVAEVAAARRKHQPLISWNAIMLRALALTSRDFPELRRSYIALPWPHFYEHPHCVAAIVVEREWRGENAVFFDHALAPERQSLRELDMYLRGLRERPVASVGGYRRLIRIARLPLPLRRLMSWLTFCGSGRMRSRYVGTFGLNSIPARRTFTTQTVAPATFTVFFGSVDAEGDMPVQLFFDHRVADGNTAARLLNRLNAILRVEIVAELDASN